MEEMIRLLQEIFAASVSRIIISNPRPEHPDRRVTIRRVALHDGVKYQIERLSSKQAFHENVEEEEAILYAASAMEHYRQLDAWTRESVYAIKISKKGKLLWNRRKKTEEETKADPSHESAEDLSHNRKKRYLLPEGTVIELLVDLGIFTKEGKIVHSMYDKYRQIHRFVELIDEGLSSLDCGETLHIVDFGCGKSYLTFILYYFLTEIRHFQVEMTGLDLKEDVVANCREIAKRYGYTHLSFRTGDIADYEPERRIDLMISLHACDTATDYALYNAIRRKARLIFSVPCCRHEVNAQLGQEALPGVTNYGILKERFAALLTDGVRAEILRAMGYQVQILEFVDFAHSPKNLLIRARYSGHRNEQALRNVRSLTGELGIHPMLCTLCKEELG